MAAALSSLDIGLFSVFQARGAGGRDGALGLVYLALAGRQRCNFDAHLTLFLSLAFVKRFAELENLRASGASPRNGRGYLVADIEQLRSFGTASAFAAVVVFANYISGRDVTALYHQPRMLWMIMPMIILWLCRVWLLASRGELNEDPVVFALTDRTSLLIGAAVLIIALLAR